MRVLFLISVKFSPTLRAFPSPNHIDEELLHVTAAQFRVSVDHLI